MKTYFISYTVQSHDGKEFESSSFFCKANDEYDVRSQIAAIKKEFNDCIVVILACNPI